MRVADRVRERRWTAARACGRTSSRDRVAHRPRRESSARCQTTAHGEPVADGSRGNHWFDSRVLEFRDLAETHSRTDGVVDESDTRHAHPADYAFDLARHRSDLRSRACASIGESRSERSVETEHTRNFYGPFAQRADRV